MGTFRGKLGEPHENPLGTYKKTKTKNCMSFACQHVDIG
jgi:hypothetical protein